MKQPLITRRQFLKAGAFGVGLLAVSTAGLASVVAPPPKEARAAAEQPNKLAIPQATFNAIASTTLFGPPTDLSAGWDGTLWATDASGAPHLYDPMANQWNPHGESIEAATAIDNTLYVFKGDQYITVDLTTKTVSSSPTLIAKTWPKLPDSFKLRLTGATSEGGKLVLLCGGWYAYADGSQPPRKLTDITQWPKTPNWVDGLVDAASFTEFGSANFLYLFRGNEYIGVNLYLNFVFGPPLPAKNVLPPNLVTSGIDAATYHAVTGDTYYFHGTSVVFAPYAGGTQTYYLPQLFKKWPATWHPQLQHAPSGRMGNVWASALDGRVMQHNGEHWAETPGVGSSTSVGQDNSVYVIGTDGGLFRWNGTAFAPQGNLAPLTQVSVGDDAHVWVRDGNNAVHRYIGNNAFAPVNLGGEVPNPTHMAANADGTLWHCNSAVANAHRFISEASAPSDTIPVKQGSVTSVQKVASTGFGAAYCLVTQSGQSQPQVYRYDSPYLFKTAGDSPIMGNGGDGFLASVTGGTFAQGLGNLYGTQFVSLDPGHTLTVRLIALDAHTGREVARNALPPGTVQYTGLIFDPIHELIYVGTAPWSSLPDQTAQTASGQLIAYDARTLAVKWTFTTAGGIDGVPTLSGTQLCFGDRANTLYMIDTRTALAAANHNQAITPEWSWVVPTRSVRHRMSSPVIANGKVYAVAWDFDIQAINGQQVGNYHYLAICDAATGLNGTTRIGDFIPDDTHKSLAYQFLVSAPVLGTTLATDQTETDAVYVNDGFSVFVHALDTTRTPSQSSFALPGGQISTGFAYDDGSRVTSTGLPSGGPDLTEIRLWFGDSLGNLWSLNYALHSTDSTPKLIAQNTQIVSTPVLYKDPQGGLTVLFGVLDGANTLPPGLYGYDPENGNHASVSTGVTGITMLSAGVTNGLVYAGGVYQPGDPPGSPKQVFGVRVDKLPQALRDFVIESQMMQDPDETAPGGDPTDPANPIPPSRARYQTHLTVIYNDPTQPGTISPLPNESVKIWADTPTTIAVDGIRYVIGPDDSQYAAVKTGVDGSLVITSGYIEPNGADTPDVYASPLRVWAAFMDPYERIVVNPDHEFHGRVSTAHANASDDDPDKANLVTTKSYAGRQGAKPALLFSATEQTAGQPQHCADAISQMKSGVDFGGAGNSAKTLFNRLMLHTGGSKTARRVIQRDRQTLIATAQSPQKYMAYGDLTSAGYFPANIPAPRPTSIAKPTGLLFVKPRGQPTTSATFTATNHMAAQAAIDALPPPTVNPPWEQPSFNTQGAGGPFVVRRADNIFTDFWHWLKREFEKLVIEITDILVSIADEVMVGIRMLVNGVETVFKAIVKVIDDIASAIGSFFKMLSKFIEDVIAALSVLFHFGYIIATQKFLVSDLKAQVAGIKTAIAQSVQPNVDAFFKTVETDIVDTFKQLRAGINGDQISNLQGSGATTHTAFKVGPGNAGPNSSGSSHAVHCSWGTHKARTGLPNATGDTSSGSSAPFVSAIETFINRITGDGNLSAAFTQLKSDFDRLFHAHSATEFFTTALDILLDILETLVVSLVAVGGAFMDALLGIVEQTIDLFMGLLDAGLNIPVLSWLYQLLFDQPLTVMNALGLITAIPVTIIYRVAKGSYPFPALAAQRTQHVDALTATINDIIRGLARGVVALLIGLARAAADVFDAKQAPMYAKFLFGAGLTYVLLAFTQVVGTGASALAWVGWGFGLVMAISGATALFTFSDEIKPVLKILMPVIRMVLGVGRLIVFCFAFAASPNKNASTNTGFARNLFLCLPPIVNPLKLLPAEAGAIGAIIDGVVDIGAGLAVCAMDIALVFITADPEPLHHYYFPILSQGKSALADP